MLSTYFDSNEIMLFVYGFQSKYFGGLACGIKGLGPLRLDYINIILIIVQKVFDGKLLMLPCALRLLWIKRNSREKHKIIKRLYRFCTNKRVFKT